MESDPLKGIDKEPKSAKSYRVPIVLVHVRVHMCLCVYINIRFATQGAQYSSVSRGYVRFAPLDVQYVVLSLQFASSPQWTSSPPEVVILCSMTTRAHLWQLRFFRLPSRANHFYQHHHFRKSKQK